MKAQLNNETIQDETFNIVNYGNNLNKQHEYIEQKISKAEIKITSLKSKESIIDNMITRGNNQVEKYHSENNFKLAGIHSSHILTQFETLAQVQEMLIKYEDMIQKYIKMNIDIENHKINAFVKLNSSKKAESKNEEGYDKLMGAVHELMMGNQQDATNVMTDTVRRQLKLEGY